MSEARKLYEGSQDAPRLDQLMMLLDVCRYMGLEKNLDKLLVYIAEQGRKALLADRCSIFLLDAEKGEIWSKVQLGENQIIRFPRGSGVAGRCIDSGRVIKIDDAYTSTIFNADIDRVTGYRTQNILCVPLANLDGRSIGCLQLLNKVGGNFDTADESFSVAFAAQAAVAIESAYLYQEKARIIGDLSHTQVRLKQKIDQLEVVRELEQYLNDSATLYDFISQVIRRAVRSLGAEAGCLMIETEGLHWETYAARIEAKSRVLHLTEQRLDNPRLLELLKGGQSIILNVAEVPDGVAQRVAAELDFQIKNLMAIPMHQSLAEGKEAVQGIFQVFNKPGGFSGEDLAFLQVIGMQIISLVIRRQLVEEKERAKNLAAIGQLASTIIHDLKNPISAIIGCVELMGAQSERNPPPMERIGNIIRNQANRCITMVEELLSVARGEKRFRFEIMTLGEVLEEIASMLELETQRRKVRLETDFAYQGRVRVDRQKLMRVIFNLTNNALEVLKEGGKIKISTRPLDATWMEIAITDNGPGVPADIAKSLFQPFATFGKAKGTGLGLYISREIIKDHGGHIELDASYRDGARFCIRLKQEA